MNENEIALWCQWMCWRAGADKHRAIKELCDLAVQGRRNAAAPTPRTDVDEVKRFWRDYQQGRIDGDDFANLVSTQFQFELRPKTNTSPTPRTDAAAFGWALDGQPTKHYVTADFARKLEIESDDRTRKLIATQELLITRNNELLLALYGRKDAPHVNETISTFVGRSKCGLS